jgi:hypothetical protein
MAWEYRKGHRYYYRSQRTADGLVRKVYLGCGLAGEIEASRLEKRRLERNRHQQQLIELRDCDAQLDTLAELLEAILNDQLHKAGYRNDRNRGWRLRRVQAEEKNAELAVDDPVQHTPASADQPASIKPDEFSAIVDSAKKGCQQASRQLLQIFGEHPHLAGQTGNLSARLIWHWIRLNAGDDEHLRQCLLTEVKNQRLLLARENGGGLLQEKCIDLVVLSWLQMNFYQLKDLTTGPETLAYARYREERYDRTLKRHVKALELLSKLSGARSATKIENITVNNFRQPKKRRKAAAGTTENRVSKILDHLTQSAN